MEQKKRTGVRPTDQDREIGKYLSARVNSAAGDEMHLTPEEIAAVLDGRMSGAERERALGHLAGCGECYAVYRSALQSQREFGPTPTSRLRRALTLGLPLAAAAAMLLVVIQYRGTPKGDGTTIVLQQPAIEEQRRPGPAELAAALQETPGVLALIETGPAPEEGGYGFASVLTKEQRAFRLGTTLMGLSTSLLKNDRARSIRRLVQIEQLLADDPAFRGANAPFRKIRRAIERGEQPSLRKIDDAHLLPLLKSEKTLFFYTLGVWAEAVRFGAEAGSQGRNDAFLRLLRKMETARPAEQKLRNANVPDRVVRAMGSIAGFAGARTLTRQECAAIRDTALAIIDEMQ